MAAASIDCGSLMSLAGFSLMPMPEHLVSVCFILVLFRAYFCLSWRHGWYLCLGTLVTRERRSAFGLGLPCLQVLHIAPMPV